MQLYLARLLAIVALVATSAYAAPARSVFPPLAAPGAQARFARALSLYSRGVALKKDGDTQRGGALLDESISELRALDGLEPHAWISYSLGQALRQRGDCDDAMVAYRRALAQVPQEAIGEASRNEFVERTKQQIGGCVVESGSTPRPVPVEVPPAPVVAPIVPDVRPSEPAPIVIASARKPNRYSVAAPVTVGAVAVALLVGGGALYAVSGNSYDSLVHQGCGVTHPCTGSAVDGTQARERAGIGLLVVGGAFAAIDVGLWAAWRRR